MSANDDVLHEPMVYDVMREALNRYRGRCIALGRQAPTPRERQAWVERGREAEKDADAVDPLSRSQVEAMTARLHHLHTQLPSPRAVLTPR